MRFVDVRTSDQFDVQALHSIEYEIAVAQRAPLIFQRSIFGFEYRMRCIRGGLIQG
jgi:hypothetical protein